jgi:hypothetical protein
MLGIMPGVISVPAGVRERGLGREVDLLSGELALHGVVHVGRTPQQQSARYQQDRRGSESRDGGQTGIAAYRNASFCGPGLYRPA